MAKAVSDKLAAVIDIAGALLLTCLLGAHVSYMGGASSIYMFVSLSVCMIVYVCM